MSKKMSRKLRLGQMPAFRRCPRQLAAHATPASLARNNELHQDAQARKIIHKRAQRSAPLRAPLHAPLRAPLARCAPRSARTAQRNASSPMQPTSYYHHPTTHGPANEHPTPPPGSFVGHAPPSVRRCLRGDDGDGARRRAAQRRWRR